MQRYIPTRLAQQGFRGSDLREQCLCGRPVCIQQSTGRTCVMDGINQNLTIDSRSHNATGAAQGESRPDRNVWPWVNWGLALSTVPAAAIVMLFALGAVLSTDNCSDRQCPNLARGGIDFGLAFYGAPVVPFVVIAISFFTAKRRGGIAVPLCGWALLVADVAVMAATVAS